MTSAGSRRTLDEARTLSWSLGCGPSGDREPACAADSPDRRRGSAIGHRSLGPIEVRRPDGGRLGRHLPWSPLGPRATATGKDSPSTRRAAGLRAPHTLGTPRD